MGSVRQKAPRQGWRSSPGCGRRGAAHVVVALLGRAALVDGRQRQASGQAAGGRAGIHPGQLEGHQRQRQILRPGDEAALLGSMKTRGDAGFVEGLQQLGLVAPSTRACCARRAATRRATGPRATARDGLHQHLQIVAVGEAPQDLADVVAGQGAEGFLFGLHGRGSHVRVLSRDFPFWNLTALASVI